MMNNGDYIYLYDDGSSVVLYQPNVTSGDVMINDGIYSFNILYTALISWIQICKQKLDHLNGNLLFRMKGEYSKIKEHNVFIK